MQSLTDHITAIKVHTKPKVLTIPEPSPILPYRWHEASG